MSKKWLLVVSAFVVLSLALVLTLCIVLLLGPTLVENHSSVAYTMRQIPSTHPGYMRTTLISGSTIYVNDYEEYPLRLLNPEPTQVIGLYGIGGKVCAIPGVDQSNYIAADCGSEMPAYEIFRNTQAPPFDWRNATFQKMQFTSSVAGVNIFTTNQALIADVVHTLRDGTAAKSLPVSNTTSNPPALCLYSDQLPGMVYCPSVCFDPVGQAYLVESIAFAIPSPQSSQSQVQWKQASQQFGDWIKNPSQK